jgi:hypothetical protein
MSFLGAGLQVHDGGEVRRFRSEIDKLDWNKKQQGDQFTDHTRLGSLRRYGSVMSKLVKLQEKEPDLQAPLEQFIRGTARRGLDLRELPRYPDPFKRLDELPEQARDIIYDEIGRAAVTAGSVSNEKKAKPESIQTRDAAVAWLRDLPLEPGLIEDLLIKRLKDQGSKVDGIRSTLGRMRRQLRPGTKMD